MTVFVFYVLVLLDKTVLLIVLIIILIIRSCLTNEQYCLSRLVQVDRPSSFQYFPYQTSLYLKEPVRMFGLCGMLKPITRSAGPITVHVAVSTQ